MTRTESYRCDICKDAGVLVRYRDGHSVLSGSDLVPCACASDAAKQRARERASAACGLLPRMAALTFGAFDATRQPEAFRAAQAFAAHPARHWLVLLGAVGAGKTHLLVAIVNELLARGRQPVYAMVPDLLDHLRQGFDSGEHHQRWQELRDCDILALDDYGSEQRTAWTEERIFGLVNHRWLAGRPTAISSNLTLDTMAPRIASRLADAATSRVVVLHPTDYRRSPDRSRQRRASVSNRPP